MATISFEEFSKGKPIKSSMTSSSVPTANNAQAINVKDFASGFGKGLLRTTIGTAQGLQGLGQRIIAGVDPTQTLDQVRQNTGINAVNTFTPEGKDVDEMIQSSNRGEKIGGAAEIAAEFLIPTKIVGTMATRGLSKILPKASGVGEMVSSKVGSSNILNKIQDAVTPLEKGVESILSPTNLIPKEQLKNVSLENIVAQSVDKGKKLELYLKQAQKAVNDFSQPTPLEIAGKRAEQALNVLNNKLTKQGSIKSEALEKTGNLIVENVAPIRNKLRDLLKDRVGIVYDSIEKEVKSAPGRASKIALDAADNSMVRKIMEQIDILGDSPTVRQVDDTIDAIQDVLYKRSGNLAIPVNGVVEGTLKQITGELNGKVKSIAGEQYRKANDKFSYFIDYRDNLNKSLGTDANKGGSLMKRVFSPTDGGTKALFNKVKELTGIDLIEDATLAKFVMENVGDARQANILEELINTRSLTPTSFVGRAVDKVMNKLQDPINKARRTILKELPGAPKSSLKQKSSSTNAIQSGNEAFGGVAGLEKDEDGKINFNPDKAAIGAVGIAGFTRPQAMKNLSKKLNEATVEELAKFVTVIKGKAVKSTKSGKLVFNEIEGMNPAEVKRVFQDGLRFVSFNKVTESQLSNKAPGRIANYYEELIKARGR